MSHTSSGHVGTPPVVPQVAAGSLAGEDQRALRVVRVLPEEELVGVDVELFSSCGSAALAPQMS